MDPTCTIDFDNKTLTCNLYSEFYAKAKGDPFQTRTAYLSEETLEEARQAAQKLKDLRPGDSTAKNSPVSWKPRVVETRYECLLPKDDGTGACHGKYSMGYNISEQMFCIQVNPPKEGFRDAEYNICERVSKTTQSQLGGAVALMKSEIAMESLGHPDVEVKLWSAGAALDHFREAALNTLLPLVRSSE